VDTDKPISRGTVNLALNKLTADNEYLFDHIKDIHHSLISPDDLKINMLLEIACFNPESAKQAAEAGADRIELCINREEGGTSPPYDDFTTVKSFNTKVPINVMIRPRGGDFEYTDDEFIDMKSILVQFLALGADGFVFGILKDGHVDKTRCKELVELAKGKPCTFHRAFDELIDMETALRDVNSCGFRAILTSGGKPDAVSGSNVLKKLIMQAEEEDIDLDIIVGGGVRASNAAILSQTTRSNWYHSSALSGKTLVVSPKEVMDLKNILRDPTYHVQIHS
jgi:copper homeostasis protein